MRPAGHEHRAGDVVALTVRVVALGEQDRRERERDEADRDVDEEDPLPREEVGEDAAERGRRQRRRSRRRHPRRRGRCCARGPRWKVVVRIERAAGVMVAAPRPWSARAAISDVVAPGEPAEQRADREDDEPGHEDAPAADDVGQPAAEQQEATEDERVRADHPLQVLLREPEIGLDRGQRDVDDRDVQDDHELHGAEKRQCVPLPAIRGNHAIPLALVGSFGSKAGILAAFTFKLQVKTSISQHRACTIRKRR